MFVFLSENCHFGRSVNCISRRKVATFTEDLKMWILNVPMVLLTGMHVATCIYIYVTYIYIERYPSKNIDKKFHSRSHLIF